MTRPDAAWRHKPPFLARWGWVFIAALAIIIAAAIAGPIATKAISQAALDAVQMGKGDKTQ